MNSFEKKTHMKNIFFIITLHLISSKQASLMCRTLNVLSVILLT